MIIKGKYIFIFVVSALVAIMLWNSFTQPGVNDLKGDFKEVAMYRNENNTGPIQRIYAVTVADTLWSEVEQYGNFMPYTKLGNTKVFFFLEGKPVPTKLVPTVPHFSPEFNSFCIALYEKNTSGLVSLSKYPFE